jgi:Tn3 transposase DDE domain
VQIISAAEGRVRLSVGRLDAVGEPESLRQLREMVAAMLPRADLPDLLLEVHAWTGYLDACTHAARGPSSWVEDLPVSVAALLVAEACNLGLTPVVKPRVPALTRDRLRSTGSAASCGRHTGKARKTSSACSAWCSNVVVLWNTGYTDAAVAGLRSSGYPVAGEDAARLSPLGDKHVNMLGRYSSTAPLPGGLRPLRDPSAPDSDQDESYDHR